MAKKVMRFALSSKHEIINWWKRLNFQNTIVRVQVCKSFSEALILASLNPQYDKRLFIELQVRYMKIASSEHVVYINCSECQNKKQFVYTTCSELTSFMYWTRNSMNNLLSYCGLVDAKIRASDKD
jgi:hypothetical protein